MPSGDLFLLNVHCFKTVKTLYHCQHFPQFILANAMLRNFSSAIGCLKFNSVHTKHSMDELQFIEVKISFFSLFFLLMVYDDSSEIIS